MCTIIPYYQVTEAFDSITSSIITPNEVLTTIQDKLHTKLKHMPHIKAFIKTHMESRGYMYNEENDIYMRRVK